MIYIIPKLWAQLVTLFYVLHSLYIHFNLVNVRYERKMDALVTYCQIPHPSTSLPPANMLFHDGMKYSFPRRYSTDKELQEARMTDFVTKVNRRENANTSKYRKQSAVSPGDVFLARDVPGIPCRSFCDFEYWWGCRQSCINIIRLTIF